MSQIAQYVRITENELNNILAEENGEQLRLLLSEQQDRLGTDDISRFCWEYTWVRVSTPGMRWTGSSAEQYAKQLGLIEEQVKKEIELRGLHLWLDLDKVWNEMHILLTGKDFIKSADPFQQRVKPLVARAEQNTAFAKDVIAKMVQSADKAEEIVRQSLKLIKTKQKQCKGGTDKNRLFSDLRQQIAFAPSLLSRQMTMIAGMEEHYDATVIAQCENQLLKSANSAMAIKALMTDLLTKLTQEEFETIGNLGQKISKESGLLLQLQQEILSITINAPKKDSSAAAIADKTITRSKFADEKTGDILSLAISGSEQIEGFDEIRYLNAKFVKKIARELLQSNYADLALANDHGIDHFENCFDKFKEFYVDAAANTEAVLCIF
jgi:Domain of unknown function (DUF1877)